MSSFSKFRNNSSIDNLKDKFNKLSGQSNFNNGLDETYWTTKHVGGSDGVGEAVVRFLPAPPDGQGGQEPDDTVKYFQFSISKKGKFYINRGRNTLGRDEADPANEYNMSIWAREDLTKEQKKKLLVNRAEYYIANVYIVKDPNKPENEGKVLRWQFGRQIYNMIHEQLFPEFESDKPVPVFDPELGADFIFRINHKMVPDRVTGENKRIPTYENSKFANPSIRWTLDEFDPIWNKCHSLQSEIAPDKFKSYEELKKQFDRVMGAEESSEVRNNTKTYTENKRTAPVQEEKTLKEEMNDDLPWDTDDEVEEDNSSLFDSDSKSSSDDSVDSDLTDWFNDLK